MILTENCQRTLTYIFFILYPKKYRIISFCTKIAQISFQINLASKAISGILTGDYIWQLGSLGVRSCRLIPVSRRCRMAFLSAARTHRQEILCGNHTGCQRGRQARLRVTKGVTLYGNGNVAHTPKLRVVPKMGSQNTRSGGGMMKR